MVTAVVASLAIVAVGSADRGGPGPVGAGASSSVRTRAAVIATNPFLRHPPFAAGFPAARRAAKARKRVDPAGAAALELIARQPIAHWLGPWYSQRQVSVVVKHLTKEAARKGRTPVFVTYAIPARDCNGHSSGGLKSRKAYRSWTKAVASGIKGRRAVVIVEPDSVAMLGDCPGQGKRAAMLRSHVRTLTKAGAVVYLDAGHSHWKPVALMAQRLRSAGVGGARGFAVNVSNFGTNASEQRYAEELSAALGGKHYIIDTSRNGRGRGVGWCNPSGRALGTTPRAVRNQGHLDAFLWIKTPGLSDGACNGGPPAGTLWPRYAIGLAKRAGW
jgi:endoglucanase